MRKEKPSLRNTCFSHPCKAHHHPGKPSLFQPRHYCSFRPPSWSLHLSSVWKLEGCCQKTSKAQIPDSLQPEQLPRLILAHLLITTTSFSWSYYCKPARLKSVQKDKGHIPFLLSAVRCILTLFLSAPPLFKETQTVHLRCQGFTAYPYPSNTSESLTKGQLPCLKGSVTQLEMFSTELLSFLLLTSAEMLCCPA